MERTKLLTLIIIGLLILNLFTISVVWFKSSSAQLLDHPDLPPPGREEPSTLIIRRLHFNEQQQRQYRELVAEHQDRTQQLNNQAAQLYRTYYGLLASPSVDTVRANSINQEIAHNQQVTAQLNFSHFQQIKALCRPDQQGYFTNLVDELAHLFGRRQHTPHQPPGGPPGPHPDGPPGEPENFSKKP